jgi:hypothetical protein
MLNQSAHTTILLSFLLRTARPYAEHGSVGSARKTVLIVDH